MKPEIGKLLKDVELQLNYFKYKNVSTGALLAKFNHNIFKDVSGKSTNLFKLFVLIRFVLVGLFRKEIKLNKEVTSRLMFSKLANKPQCNRLIDPLYRHFEGSVLWKFYEAGDMNHPESIKRVSLTQLPAAIFYSLGVARTAINCYSSISGVSILDIFLAKFFGIIQMQNWIAFFEKNWFELVVIDFDRDSKTTPLVLAAKACGIKTVTMVHGVINPPFSYCPVVADEIFVWGEYQKRYFINNGIAIERIHVVGNSIIQRFGQPKVTSENFACLTIGIALNPMGNEYNQLFIRNIVDFSKNHQGYGFIVKLHSSMPKLTWMNDLENEKLSFYSFDELSLAEFFRRSAVIIVGNSGLGFEAVVNDVPVVVIKLDLSSVGNDHIMVKDGKFPDVTLKEHFDRFLLSMNSTGKRELLLKREKEFVVGEYYSAIDKEAVNNTVVHINARVSS